MTKGVLQGDVIVVAHPSYNTLDLRLDIVAPVIGNYRYAVLTASHAVELYPVKVIPEWAKYESAKQIDCADEAAFESALEGILSSERIRRVIGSLLAQSRAM